MLYSRYLVAALPALALLGACARQPGTTAATSAAAATPATPTASATSAGITAAAPAGSRSAVMGATTGAGKAPGRFLAAPPTIDGKADDWADSLRYDAGSKVQYQVLNDARTVYVRLKVADASEQAKLALLGLVVWLDSTGRNQQQLGVHFPLGIDLATLKVPASDRPMGAAGPSAAERQAAHVARLHEVLDNAREMELLHYKGSKEPTLTDTESLLGVKAAARLDAQDNLIYELAVPLRLLFRRVPNLAAGRPATVGVWLAGQRPPTPKSDGSNSDYSTMGGSGMGNMGGGYGGGYGSGRMRGGMGGGMRGGGMQNSITTVSLKTSVQLVGK